jgi:ribosomal protein L37E
LQGAWFAAHGRYWRPAGGAESSHHGYAETGNNSPHILGMPKHVSRALNEPGVTVECLRCGHVGFLSRETLSRRAIVPGTPIAAFVKRLRCRKCGSRSVLAVRGSAPRPQRAS